MKQRSSLKEVLTHMFGRTSTIKGRQKGSRFSYIAYCLGTLLVLWMGGFVAFVFYAAQTSDRAAPISTPVAVVFTGGSGRIQAGLSLLQAGHIERLFISGVTTGTTPAVFEAVYPDARSFKTESLSLGYDATTTHENALEVGEWLQENYPTGGPCLLVTSDYHMPRSLKEMHRALPQNIQVLPHPLSSEDLSFMRRLGCFFSEYNKFLVQSVCYGLLDLAEEVMGHKTEKSA